MSKTGKQIHNLAKALWPLNRSITGDGVRKTLSILQSEIPELKIFEVPSGNQVFDWQVPKEWQIKDAFIVKPNGEKICEFNKNNLHVVGYSAPVHEKLNLTELQNYLYSLPEQPEAIPYVTSYYEERWGFCISQNDRQKLEEGEYEVFIDSEIFDGSLTYAELLIPGSTTEEIFLSTYICHPSMGNNELSGPCVTTFLAKKIRELKNLRYSYRIIFIPETIGSIVYLSKNLKILKSQVVAGFNIHCVGDDRSYSYLPSRNGKTLSDQVSKHVLKHIYPSYKKYSWLDRGGDERQYCAPGIDLPIASIMRTKYGEYPEYHTSLDDLENVVTPDGLEGGFMALWRAVEVLERNLYPKVTVLGEPQLGKRGLYPNLSIKGNYEDTRLMMDLLTYADGSLSMLEIAELLDIPCWDLYPLVEKLEEHHLIKLNEKPI